MSASDFFADAAREAGGPARDGRDRPMLVPRGAPAGTRAPYMRASSFAERVEDHRHIYTWEKRYLAQGMGKNRDLADLAAGEEYVSSKLAPDVDKNRAAGRRLDSIIHRALDRQGIHFLADRGTAYHSFCENRRRLHDGSIPAEYIEGCKAYWGAMDAHRLIVGDTEIFVANDELGAAGTFDSLVFDESVGLWRVNDIKTGDISEGYAVQEVVYAHAERYDTDTDERSPLLTPEQAEMGPLDLKVGLISQIIPEHTDKKGKSIPAECKVIEVDLVEALIVAKSLREILDRFKAANLFVTRKSPKVLTLVDRIGQTQNLNEIKLLWERNLDSWGPTEVAAAQQRKAELEA